MPTIDMATVLSQIPHVQNVAGAQQSIPAAQQAAIATAVQQAFETQKKQVKKIEKHEPLEALTKDREKNKGKHYATFGKKSGEDESAKQPVETTASNASPWSGNIIDVKI
jgi:hypothetical protein